MAGIDEISAGIIYDLGKLEADTHYAYHEEIKKHVKVIQDETATIREKLEALSMIGLADNKISEERVIGAVKFIVKELKWQDKWMRWGRIQNIIESEDRCEERIQEIALLISPEYVDISAGERKKLDEGNSGKSIRDIVEGGQL